MIFVIWQDKYHSDNYAISKISTSPQRWKWTEGWMIWNGKECFTHLHGGLEYSYILPLPENIMTPICASQRMASSFAFLNNPIRLLEKVTWRFVGFSIFFSSTFPRPIGTAWCFFFPIQPTRTYAESLQSCFRIPKYNHDNKQIKISYVREEIKVNGLESPRSWEIVTNSFSLSDAG